MKTKELLNTKISYYYRANKNLASKTLTILDYFNYGSKLKSTIDTARKLRQQNKSLYKKYKVENIPAVTISGIFDSYRRKHLISEATGIIAIDIDREDNVNVNWEEVKKKSLQIKGAFLSSLSISSDGVFVLIHYDKTLNIEDVFYALEEDFKNLGYNIDKSCKDITRMRFLTYDDNILAKSPDSEIEPYNKTSERAISSIATSKQENNDETVKPIDSYNEDDVKFLGACIFYLVDECDYKATTYNEWIAEAFRLTQLGKNGLQMFLYISRHSPGYIDDRDCVEKFYKVPVERNKETLSHYYKEVKKYLGKEWYKKIRQLYFS